MVKHIVMWTVKATDGFSKTENCLRLQEKLMALPGLISEIKEFEVGLNSVESAAAYDVGLVSAFETWDDLNTYRTHPEHLKVVDFVGQVRVERAVVDYDI
jgi:hypothetical protein